MSTVKGFVSTDNRLNILLTMWKINQGIISGTLVDLSWCNHQSDWHCNLSILRDIQTYPLWSWLDCDSWFGVTHQILLLMRLVCSAAPAPTIDVNDLSLPVDEILLIDKVRERKVCVDEDRKKGPFDIKWRSDHQHWFRAVWPHCVLFYARNSSFS